MLIAAVSTIALALALGPQLQTSLQAAIDEAQPVTESPVETGVNQPLPDPVVERDETVEDAGPSETQPQAEPVSTSMPEGDVEAAGDTATEAVAESTEAEAPAEQSGEVPEADWPIILTAASDALAAAKTASGTFRQSNADGSIVSGTFALNRPGRMRFDYDDPTPILIVSDGTTVAMEDSELETVDRVPIGATPLNLILSTDLNVDQDVEVLGIVQNEERIGIRVSDATGELEGTLTMVFDKVNYDLLGWLAVDGNLQTTVVDLVDVETNVSVDPRLFRLIEAEDEEEER